MRVLAIFLSMLLSSFFLQCQADSNRLITEASGLLSSKKYPNVFWTHNDSGDKPYLYAIDAETLEFISKIHVNDAKHKDWEDIAYFDGHIVIGDIGNNKRKRKSLKLYFINEPNPYKDKKVTSQKRIKFTYANSKGKKIKNYNSEALFSFRDALFVLTKHKKGKKTVLYKIEKNSAKKVAVYNIKGKVTAADSRGDYVAILTYDTLYLLEPSQQSDNIFDGKIHKKSIRVNKAEGVAFHKENLHVIHENSDIFTYKISDIIKD
ncbi:MAG: hypothetical protein U9P71_01120 [Campylobacterota bacterium]|nr:hypothetical protein [Campylobacterota bacterium]